MNAVDQILASTDHRPWPIPSSNWSFYQEWNEVLFLHWKVPFDRLRQLVPKELEIDIIDDSAWVSMVAFTMESLRPRQLPAVDFVSTFPELNIRTYVKYKGKPGVHFLSIEAGSRISSLMADLISELPYRYAEMNRDQGKFRSRNDNSAEHFDLSFSIGERVAEKTALDIWLTERYALFQHAGNRINAFELHHIEWPLCKLDVNGLEYEYPRFLQLFSGSPDLAHYSAGIKVVAWGKNETA